MKKTKTTKKPTKPKKYKSVPIAAARELSKKYDKAQVIVVAWDAAHGKEHVTTYGIDKEQCRQAALGGTRVKEALNWPDAVAEQRSAAEWRQHAEVLEKALAEQREIRKGLEGALEEAIRFATDSIDIMEDTLGEHEDEVEEYRAMVDSWRDALALRTAALPRTVLDGMCERLAALFGQLGLPADDELFPRVIAAVTGIPLLKKKPSPPSLLQQVEERDPYAADRELAQITGEPVARFTSTSESAAEIATHAEFAAKLEVEDVVKCDGKYVDFMGLRRDCLAGGEGCGLAECPSASASTAGWGTAE